METKKKPVCMLCGKPSEKSICTACAQRVQGEHGDSRSKNDKSGQ
jgi:hypothetical protein